MATTHAETITMGTSPKCDVTIAGDPYISDRHCRITRDAYPLAEGAACRLWVGDFGFAASDADRTKIAELLAKRFNLDAMHIRDCTAESDSNDPDYAAVTVTLAYRIPVAEMTSILSQSLVEGQFSVVSWYSDDDPASQGRRP